MSGVLLEEQQSEVFEINLQDLDAMLDHLMVDTKPAVSRSEITTPSSTTDATADPMHWFNQAVHLLYNYIDESFVGRVQNLLAEALPKAGITFYEWAPAREKQLSLQALQRQIDALLRPWQEKAEGDSQPAGIMRRIQDLQREIETLKEGIRGLRFSTADPAVSDYVAALKQISTADVTMTQETNSQQYAEYSLQSLLQQQEWLLRQLAKKISQRVKQYTSFNKGIEKSYAVVVAQQEAEKQQCKKLLRRLVDQFERTIAEKDIPASDALRHLIDTDQEFDPETIDALVTYIQHMEKKRTSRVAPSPWQEIVKKFQGCVDTLNQRWQENYRQRMRQYAHLETEFSASLDRLLDCAQKQWQQTTTSTLADWNKREKLARQEHEEVLQHALTRRHVALERIEDLQKRSGDEKLQTFRQLYKMLNDLQDRLQRLQSFRNAYTRVFSLRDALE